MNPPRFRRYTPANRGSHRYSQYSGNPVEELIPVPKPESRTVVSSRTTAGGRSDGPRVPSDCVSAVWLHGQEVVARQRPHCGVCGVTSVRGTRSRKGSADRRALRPPRGRQPARSPAGLVIDQPASGLLMGVLVSRSPETGCVPTVLALVVIEVC